MTDRHPTSDQLERELIEDLVLNDAIPARQIIATVPALVTTASPAVSTFDYAGIDPAIADQARKAADRIRTRIRASLIDVGKDLLAIKDKLGHGKFGPWLAAEFNMSERAAQNYMAAAREFGDESASIALLPPTTIYKLAAPSTPATVRRAVIIDLKAGKSLSAPEVESRISAAKAEERERREKEDKKKRKEVREAAETPEQVKKREAAEARGERRRKAEEEKVAAAAEKRRDMVSKTVELLKKRFGPDFEKFRHLVIEVGWFDIDRALKAESLT